MRQSLSRLYVHLVFSTKYRERLLNDSVRESLRAYMASVLQNLACYPVLINSVEDHVHILMELARTVSISQAVEKVKISSSKWLKTQGTELMRFTWQAGYGAFSISKSNVQAVREYVANQRQHHRVRSFQKEYRSLLEKHGVPYDEQYVWD